MKPKLIIIYWRFYDFDGSKRFIGGIETYLYHLSNLATKIGFDTYIYQCSSKPFVIKTDNYTVIGVKTPTVSLLELNNLKIIYNEAIKNIIKNKDIIVFGNYEWSLNTKNITSISIQHGIAWDKPVEYLTQKAYLKLGIGAKIRRLTLRRTALTFFNKANYKICVDYNFLNWYRTYQDVDDKIQVIPNCTELISEEALSKKLANILIVPKVRVLFARRFEPFRGTRIIIPTIKTILNAYENVYFTLAGDGSDSELLKKNFINEQRVTFLKYNAEKALEINYNHDISLIPSIGSEGTSFSVAEALGTGTVVVASDTGGITNMILNNYNGLLIKPTSGELNNSISFLVKNAAERKRIAYNGYQTAKYSFSKELWEEKWKKFFDNLRPGLLAK